MTAPDLHQVLTILYEAGASRVPASEVAWTEDMTPALNRALNMQYIARQDTSSGRIFSLTEAGYTAIGQKPPGYISVGRMVRSMFRIGGGHLD